MIKTGISDQKLKTYAMRIFQELNEYRNENNFEPQIKWKPKLEETTYKEAQEIQEKQNFGSHAKFDTWESTVENKYFTEFSVIVDAKQDNGLPAPNVFAISVLHAIITKEKFYLIHGYKYGAVSVIQNVNNKNQYIVVIHLLKDKKIKKYESCKQALAEGDKSNVIVGKDGKKLKCEQEIDGGGWSQVLDAALVIPIDDRGMKYKEILFKARKNYYQTSEFKLKKAYDQDGYCFMYNTLRFGNVWYIDKRAEKYKIKYKFYDAKKVTEIIKPTTLCYYQKKNRDWLCGKIFKFTKIPSGRLNAFSENQSVAKVWTKNNLYKWDFLLYVR